MGQLSGALFPAPSHLGSISPFLASSIPGNREPRMGQIASELGPAGQYSFPHTGLSHCFLLFFSKTLILLSLSFFLSLFKHYLYGNSKETSILPRASQYQILCPLRFWKCHPVQFSPTSHAWNETLRRRVLSSMDKGCKRRFSGSRVERLPPLSHPSSLQQCSA